MKLVTGGLLGTVINYFIMNNKQIQETLDAVVHSSNYESFIAKIVSVAPCLGDEGLASVLDFVRSQLLSRHSSSYVKVRVLKLINALMITNIDKVVYYVARKIVTKLMKLVNSKENLSSFDHWVYLIQNFDQTTFELALQVLKTVETWAEGHTTDLKGKPSRFYEVYQEMKSLDLEFPPEFLFENLANSAVQFSKRDLSRSRKLCKELKKSFSIKTKKKAMILNTLCEMYQRQIEIGIDWITKERRKVSDDLIWTYSEISESMSLYQAWKANGYQLKEEGNLSMPSCLQLEDIVPKCPPSPDSLSNSFEMFAVRDSLQITDRDERESIMKEEDFTSPEYYKMKEKLTDMEELVSMYKADLSKLQTKFLDVTEKKEELKYRINAILFSNREINKLLTEANKKVEDLSSQNFSLNEDLEAFKSQNESLKVSIREIQDCCIKYEKEIEKQKKLIENLENRNMALGDSNLTLKVESEKKGSGSSWVKQLVPNIFMPKHLGDSENSYNISLSDSESDPQYNENPK